MQPPPALQSPPSSWHSLGEPWGVLLGLSPGSCAVWGSHPRLCCQKVAGSSCCRPAKPIPSCAGWPGRVPWFGQLRASLAQHTAAHWCRCGLTTCSHDHWPQPWWLQQMWDLLSWTGGWDPERQPARCRAMLRCAVLSHATWPCLHRPVLPCALHTCKAVGAVGLQPRAVLGDTGLDPSDAGGAGQGARASGQCVPSGGTHGAWPRGAAVGGREELGAAPLGALDVPAAGLSGRSRSCPDRSLAATPAASSPCRHSSARHRGPAAPLLLWPPRVASPRC